MTDVSDGQRAIRSLIADHQGFVRLRQGRAYGNWPSAASPGLRTAQTGVMPENRSRISVIWNTTRGGTAMSTSEVRTGGASGLAEQQAAELLGQRGS